MVAKIKKSSFLKNSFQLFCNRNIFTSTTINNQNGNNNKSVKSNNRSLSNNSKVIIKQDLNNNNNNIDTKKKRSSSSNNLIQNSQIELDVPEPDEEQHQTDICLEDSKKIDFIINMRKNRSKSNNNNNFSNQKINRYSYPTEFSNEKDNNVVYEVEIDPKKNDLTTISSSSSPSSVSSNTEDNKSNSKSLYKNGKSITELKQAKKMHLMKQLEQQQMNQSQVDSNYSRVISNNIKLNGDFLTRLNEQLLISKSSNVNNNNMNNKRNLFNNSNRQVNKKVVRFADSLGLELENVIQLNSDSSLNIHNINNRHKVKINHNLSQYAHQKFINQKFINQNNQFESENTNELCMYDEIINQTKYNNSSNDNRSRYSSHYKSMQFEPSKKHEYLYPNNNCNLNKWPTNTNNNNNSSNITTITTRLNNGKLESEV